MAATLIESRYPHLSIRGDGSLVMVPSQMKLLVVLEVLSSFGWDISTALKSYTQLSPAEAHAAMVYYLDHRPELDAELSGRKAYELAFIDKHGEGPLSRAIPVSSTADGK